MGNKYSKAKVHPSREDSFPSPENSFPSPENSFPSPENSFPNPLGYPSKCSLISSKKKEYYVHKYDPTNMIRLLKQRLHEDLVSTRFDETICEKCCNVISISLYFIECIPYNMAKYLMSIERTVKNVQNNLPDWIVRIYLDESVHNCMKTIEITSLEKKAYDYIISAPNVEIYTYNCEVIPGENIARKRTYRFLPFSDEDVNICIVREADGIVSNWDCIQIDLFSKNSDKMFYFPYNHIPRETMSMFESYERWLLLYKVIFCYDFFSNNYMGYDLLAGLFGIKLKLKRQYYIDTIVNLRDKIDDFILKVSPTYDNDEAYNGHGNDKYLTQTGMRTGMRTIKNIMNQTNDVLSIGFDEILLLEMFKEVFSFPVSPGHLVKDNVNDNDIRIGDDHIEEYNQLKGNIQHFVLDESTYDKKIVISLHNVNDYDTISKNDTIRKSICEELDEAGIIRECKDKIKIDGKLDKWLYFIDGQLLDKTNLNSNITFSITLQYYYSNVLSYKEIVSHLLNEPYSKTYDIYYNNISPLSQHRGGYNITKINRRHKRYIREYKSKHKRCIRNYKSKHKKQRTKNNKTHRRFRGI